MCLGIQLSVTCTQINTNMLQALEVIKTHMYMYLVCLIVIIACVATLLVVAMATHHQFCNTDSIDTFFTCTCMLLFSPVCLNN